jgi:hypothetical protein
MRSSSGSQKQRLPTLNPEQVQTLYAEWQDRYAAKCAQDRNKAAEHLTRYIEEQARQSPPPPPFKWVCGAETKDSMDPEFMRIHQPHCQAAGEERIAHEQRERRARQRSGSASIKRSGSGG